MNRTKSKLGVFAVSLFVFGFCVSIAPAAEIVALTNNDVNDIALSASLGNAVWQGQDPNGGDWEIFCYSKDANEVKQITDNDVNDVNPIIAGDYIAWEVFDGNDWEIMVYNGNQATQITDNDVDDVEPKMSAPFIFWRVFDGNDWEINKTTLPRPPVAAKCKITPQTLNLKSKGNWIDAIVILPVGTNVKDVKIDTILLEGQLAPVKIMTYPTARTIHMKFDRAQLQAILTSGAAVKLDITMELKDGTHITTCDTIRVIH